MRDDITQCDNPLCPLPESYYNNYHDTGMCTVCCSRLVKDCPECLEEQYVEQEWQADEDKYDRWDEDDYLDDNED